MLSTAESETATWPLLPEADDWLEEDPPAGTERASKYYRARYYDPTIGRFISEDPIGSEGGNNFYAYVDNNPASYVDPMGLSGSRPGGPFHPPPGVHTKCRPDDDCKTIIAKLWLLGRMIKSHTGWDIENGTNKHAREIADLWKLWAECQSLLPMCQDRAPLVCKDDDKVCRTVTVVASIALSCLTRGRTPIPRF